LSIFAAPGAYDRAITVFSPDGRLFQVEYALETVNRGATIMGIACQEGIVLGAEEKLESKLQDPNFAWKLFPVDTHIGAAVVGLGSDARILIDQARVYCQSNRLMYDEPIDVEIISKRIGDIKQLYTQHAGVRPFGVSIIFGGVDKTGTRLFSTDPSGTYRAYKAVAVGVGRETVEGILKTDYREDMGLDEMAQLAIKCLKKALQARDEQLRVKIAFIPASTKTWRPMPDEEVEKHLKTID
jgi:proteasome alpha subunit